MRKWHGFLILILMLSLSRAASQLPQVSEASPLYAIIPVNSFDDDSDVNPGDGVCETGVGTGVCTLRAAIEEANALAGLDEINLPAGTYTLVNGQLEVTDDLIINGDNNPTIDGAGNSRILDITANPAILTLNTLVLANGDAGGGNGGGVLISVQDGELVLNNSIIQDSTAFDGGAIYNDSGTVTLQNSVLDTNSATNEGGGIYSIVTGIGANSLVNIFDSMLVGNSAVNGGGFLINDSTAVITGSTFTLNTATGQGGAINLIGLGQLDMMNSTISGNTAQTAGGGVSVDAAGFASSANLNHTTLFENTTVVNTAGSGGNIRFDADGTLTVTASIVTGGDTGGDCVVVSGTSTFGENLATIGQCGAAADATNLGPLADNGGPTQTHALLVAGSNAENGVAVCAVGTDQRGDPRTLGGTCDIGAFEASNTPEIQVEDALGNIIPDGGTFVFPTTTFVGSGGITQTITVRNLGGAPLNLLTNPPTAAPVIDFTTSNFVAVVVPPLGTTTFDLTCEAATIGNPVPGTITFDNDDADESTFNFDVECVVTATPEPEIQVLNGATDLQDNVTVVDFGTTPVSTPVDITLTVNNIGTADLTLTQPADPADYTILAFPVSPIAPGGTANLTIQCSATAAGTFSPTLSFTNGDLDENTFDIPLTCNVVAPEIRVFDGVTEILDNQVTPVDFGVTTVGTPLDIVFTIDNVLGTADLTLTAPADPTGYAVQGVFPTTVAVGATADFTLQCTAAAQGTFTTALSIANNDADENPFEIPITCQVNAPPEIQVFNGATEIIDSITTVDFGTPAVGNPVDIILTINNIGGTDLTLTQPADPTGYSIQGVFPTTIAAGGTADFILRCDAAAGGIFNTTLSIDNNDADEDPFDIPIACTVVTAPEIEIVNGATTLQDGVSTVDFGAPIVGNPVDIVLTINNLGTDDLTLTAPTPPAGFSIQGAFPTTVAVGTTENFTVRCDAAVADTYSGTLSIPNDDGDENPFDIFLDCQVNAAAEPEIQIVNGAVSLVNNTTVVDFGTTLEGTFVDIILTINNTGQADLTLAAPTPPTGFSIQGVFPTTIAAGGTADFTLRCDAAVPATYNDTLSIENNDSNEDPFEIPVACVVDPLVPEIQILNGVTDLTSGATLVDFGTTTVGTFVDIVLTINNLGTGDLTLVAPTPPAGYLIQGVFPTTVAAGGTENFTLRCTAASAGAFPGTLSIDNNDADEDPFEIPLACQVSAPEIEVRNDGVEIIDGQPGIIDFANAVVGTPSVETFEITNAGDSQLDVSNLTLPPGFSLVGAFPASVAPGGTATFQVQCDAGADGTFTGALSFDNTDTDENPFNFTIRCVVLAANAVDIEVTKGVQDSVVAPGATVIFEIAVRNNGPANATGLSVSDLLPAGLTYLTDNSGGAYNAGTGVWTIGNLNANATITLQLQATATGAPNSDITNTASFLAVDQPEGNNVNDSGTADVHIAIPLVVTKQGFDLNGGTLQIGDTIGWIICAINPDSVSATNVIVTDTLDTTRLNPPTQIITNTTLPVCPVVAPVAGPAQPNAGGGNISVNIGALAPGATGVVYFETTVRDPGTSQKQIPALAVTGLLAVGGLFLTRMNKRKFLMLVLLLVFIMPASTIYAQGEGETPTEEVTPEPPPLPFTEPTPEPTPIELPFVSPTPTATLTETPTATPSLTETPTATPTVEGQVPPPTSTETPIPTNTVEGVSTSIPTETPVVVTPEVEPSPDEEGWTRYEMSDPRILLSGIWEMIESPNVSGGSYIYTADSNGAVVLEFEGESVRFDYLRFKNFGVFEVYLDDVLVGALSGYSEESDIETTEPFTTTPGIHRLRIQNTQDINNEGKAVLAIDAIEIKGQLLAFSPETPTPIASVVVVPTETFTPIATVEGEPTLTPSNTPEIVVIPPDVLPDGQPANTTLPVTEGWTRLEMDHPSINQSGNWKAVESPYVSGGSYIYSTNGSAAVEVTFEGDGLRLDYLQFWNFGIFDVYVDDVHVLTIDGYNSESLLTSSAQLAFSFGTHRLRIQNTGLTNENSDGVVIALDAIDVKNPLTIPTATPVPTNTPNPVNPVEPGWTRYEMDAVTLSGDWQELESNFVTGGSYSYTEEEDATAEFEFVGDSIRINYLAFSNFGIFEVFIDDNEVAVVDAFYPESRGAATANFNVAPGVHILRIVNTGRTNGDSGGIGLALDSIDVHEVELPTNTPAPIISITGNVVRGEERRPVRQAVLNLYQDDGDEEFDEDELVATVEVVDGLFEFADLEADGIYWILSPDESEMEAVQVTAPSNIEIILPSRPQSDEEVQAEITGRVFNDNNANREWSGSGESGIRDAKVYLYSDDGDEVFDPDVDVEIQNLQVKPDGTYVFAETLPVGVYWIWVDETTLPASYMDTVATGEHGIQNPKLLVIEAEQTGDETPPPTATEEALQPEMTFTADTLIVEKADFAYALDTDNDTSPDSIEGSGDRDNDGIPNYLDTFDPSGVVYSVDAAGNGNALAGATVQLVWDNGGVLTNADTVQPNPQTTGVDGGYRFDIVVGTPNGLPAGIPRTFILQITPPTGFTYPSVTFPPNAGSFDATPTPGSGQIAPFSHPPNTGQLHSFFTSFILQSGDDPVVNNHIAMDAPPTVPLALVVSNQAGASQDNAPVVQSAVVNFPLNSSLNMTFAPNNAQSGSAGQTLTYDHTLTNTGTQSDRYTFTFAAETQTPLWTHEVRILSGATVLGTIAPGGSFTLPAANAVPPNGTLTVRHIVTIPLGTANGAVNVDTITATSLSAAAGGVTLSRTVTDVTTVVSGCLQGTLFHDVNTNNIRDAGEPVFANASVIVTDTVNTPIATLTTDANGNYSLGGLPAGIYNVRVDPASITGGAVIFLNPITGQAQLNVAVGGTCIVGNFSLVLVDPAISKIGSVAQAQPGETITFTLNLTNPSTSPITNVTVVDPLNGLLTFVSATSAQGTSTFNSTTNTVTFSLGTVAPNANILMTVTVTVSSLATPGTTIQNTATLNFAEGPPETSAVVTVTIPSPATATPTASPTVVGGGAAGGGGAGGGGGTGSSGGGGGTGADTLPETGYRPLPAATNLLFGLQLDSLSAMEITLMLLALVVLLGCIGWAVVQWMAEYRSEKLALMLPNRPTRQLIRAVVTIGVVSIMVLSMVFAANINQKPAQKAAPREIADSSDFEGVEADAYLPINWQDAGQQGGFNFAPPEIAAERLIIPRIGIDTMLTNAPLVGRTWDVSGFTNEVAHLDGTAYPGTMGNAVLAGHVQHSEGLGPFRNLDQLSQGDLIIAVGEGVEYTYLITEILEVTPHAVEVTYPSNQPLITLISCTRWDDKSWSYTSRLVVRAKFKSWRNTTEETTQPQGKWTRYEIAEDDVNLDGDWQTVDSSYTSDGGYMYSKDEDAEVTLTFTGEKLRIHYLYFWEFGIFDVYVDDKKVATIDTYNPMSLVGSSEIIFVEPGRHKLRIVNTGEGNAGSQGITIALDAIDVYRVAEK